MRFRLLLLVGILSLGAAGSATAAVKGGRTEEALPEYAKVRVCHATGNGFVLVEVDVNAVVKGTGHGGHANDIIPPFRYTLSGSDGIQHYPGRNWDAETKAIWQNGCSRPPPTTATIEVFGCVEDHGDTFDATFGYNSDVAAEIPVGASNGFSPEPVDRGQVTKFDVGTVLTAFTVENVSVPSLTWTVRHGGHSDQETVSRSSPSCSSPKPEPPEPPEPAPNGPVGIFVTCVTNHGSSFDATFGYESENHDPETIPIGVANRFSPGPVDRGQPMTFRPGRHPEAFEVTGIPNSTTLRWTLALIDTRMAIATADFAAKCDRIAPSTPRPFGIFAACATRHGSTYDAVFGYVNEGVDTLRVPVGNRNSVRPGRTDQGQPESFAPGFVHAAFAVRRIPVSRSVTWRIELDHERRVAVATADLPACLTAPIRPVDDAAIRKSVEPLTAVLGGRIAFTIRLRNDGSGVLRPVAVEDTFHGAPIRVVSVVPGRGKCRVNASVRARSVRCRAKALAPGESLEIRINAEVLATGTARDRAAILHLEDSTPHDDAATAAVRVFPPFAGPGAG